jgi:outer membrane protein assembly factor BamB
MFGPKPQTAASALLALFALATLSGGAASGRPAVKWSAKLSFVNGRRTLLAADRRHIFYDNFYHIAQRQIATGRLRRKLPGAHNGPGENVQDIRVHEGRLLYLEVSERGEEESFAARLRGGPDLATLVVIDPRGKRIWKRTGHIPPPVAAVGSRVFVVDRGNLLALDLKSGKELWRMALKESAAMGPVAGASLVVVQSKASVLALAQQTGKRVWSRRLTGTPRVAAAFGERNLFLAREKSTGRDKTTTTLRALRLSDGVQAWSKTLPRLTAPAPPVVAGGSLFVTTDRDLADTGDRPTPFFALAAATGKVLWQSPTVSSTDLDVSPTVWRDQVLVWSHDLKKSLSRPCQLRGLSRSTGRALWTFPVPRSRGACTVSRPVVQGNLILFSNRSRLYALRIRVTRRRRD